MALEVWVKPYDYSNLGSISAPYVVNTMLRVEYCVDHMVAD